MPSPTAVPDVDRPGPGVQTDGGGWTHPAVLAHTVPFLAWVALMLGFDVAGERAAWTYALRTVLVVALLAALRPWRWYPRPRTRHVLPAIGTGVLVLGLWLLPFVGMRDGMPWLQELYLRFGVLPIGRLPIMHTRSVYAPAACGWPLTLVRLLGSAFVIAVAEEFFWRGFLYRRLQHGSFLRIPLGTFDREAFWTCALLFGLEHRELVAGIAAGAVYSLLLIRTRDIWAAILAHSTTNLLLGLYVLRYDAYGFW